MMLRRALFLFVLVLLGGVHVRAAEFILPSSDLSAQDVVEIQLLGLQSSKTDRSAGIEQVWIFAHPDNQAYDWPAAKVCDFV